jgi:hypothetical protein
MKKLQGQTTCIALAVAALTLAGCQTYNQQDKGTPLFKQAKLREAGIEFTKQADNNKDNKDTIIWRLEQGATFRAAGQYRESLAAFEQAEDKMGRYEEKAKVRVSNEAGAMLSNQANLPYEGRDYDKVMLSAYKALNYLQLGEFDKARPELIRAYQRQQDAVENNKKRIEKEEEEIKKARASETNAQVKASFDKARQDPKVCAALSTNYSELDTLKAYADYVNPYPVYLDGIYFLNFSTGGSDLERAHKSFERLSGLSGENKFVKSSVDAVEKALRGEPIPPTTYVLFETGCAPWRDQIRIDIPLFFIGQGNVPYAGAAFPRLKFDPCCIPSLTVSADGVEETTTTIASMDSVVAQNFKNELPTIITKTLISTTVKAAIAYGINKAASDQNQIAGFVSKIISGLGQAAMNIADTRTWTTLPKEVQICCIPTPTNQVIMLTVPASGQKIEVKVEPGSVNLICVKAINATNPLIVNQVKLKASSLVVSQANAQ